jgi:hypothetical protein
VRRSHSNPTDEQLNIRATIPRRRGGDRVIKVSSRAALGPDVIPPAFPVEPSPELRTPNVAAQTRMVSVAGIRLRSRESARAFKGIICDGISEFESYLPSHAVGLSVSPRVVYSSLTGNQ